MSDDPAAGPTAPSQTLTDLAPVLPAGEHPDPDALYEAFVGWAAGRGTTLYPHQDEATIELVSGSNVILTTPTGSGKSMVALAAHFAALADDRVSFYTAPIKALVSEKFFDLCAVFGPDNVGMLTGDASVNPDAPIIACTAEILANIALREGEGADIGMVIMDEFHFYSEPDRGWAWQVPLLELPQAQFLLMSATLGEVSRFERELTERTGRPTTVIGGVERPIPLSHEWSMTPLTEKLEELVTTHQAPVYVVHFTQAQALERANALLGLKGLLTKDEKQAIADRVAGFRFSAGFGRQLGRLVRAGIGVHHAGMLPRYRRLVEQLAQQGLLKVICGTDTLGVGINVPIRTVLFTGLTKFDGTRQRVLKAREFHQIAGRAGRAGFDTSGHVVVQAPEHAIENAKRLEKAGDDPRKLKKVQRVKPPEGFVSWTEETFDKLVNAEPEPLGSRMRVTHSMLLNVIARPGDAYPTMRRLVRENHETPHSQRRMARRAIELYRGLLESGVVERLDEPDETGRRVRLVGALQENFALNQPLAPFAVAALDMLDPEAPGYALDVVSVIEAVLDDPRVVLLQQQFKARGEAVAEMKAEGIEYEERMERLEGITWPKPLEELLVHALGIYRQSHPWVDEDALSPKSVVRDMYELGATFSEYVRWYELSRAEGLLLRYLSDCWRTLRQTVPEAARTDELDDLIEWLGEVIRQTDSSLVDEWEALTNPEAVRARLAEREADEIAPPARGITASPRAFRVMVRNAMFRRVELAAQDRWGDLGDLEANVAALLDSDDIAGVSPAQGFMSHDDWDAALGAYYEAHDHIGTDAAARSASLLLVEERPAEGEWIVQQVIDDPDGEHDWRITARVDLTASDLTGEPIVLATAFAPA